MSERERDSLEYSVRISYGDFDARDDDDDGGGVGVAFTQRNIKKVILLYCIYGTHTAQRRPCMVSESVNRERARTASL